MRLPAARREALGLWAHGLLWSSLGLLFQLGPGLANGSLGQLHLASADAGLLAVQAEHARKVLFGEAPAFTLLEAPYFSPFPYSAALTEMQLPLVFPFALLRVLGFEPLAARMALTALHGLLACGIGLLLLRDLVPGRPSWQYGFGAFLAAFLPARLEKISHPHLLAQEAWLLALWAVVRAARKPALRRWLVSYAVVLGAIQLWCSVQVTFAAALLALGALVILPLLGEERRFLGECSRGLWPWGAAALTLAMLLTWPLGAVYGAVRPEVPAFPEAYRQELLPPLWAPLLPGPAAWFEREPIGFSWEHRLGVGSVLTGVLAIGLVGALRMPGLRAAWAVLLGCFLLVAQPPGLGRFWLEAQEALSGLELLRTPGRIWVLATPLLAATVLLGLETLRGLRWGRALAVGAVLLAVLELRPAFGPAQAGLPNLSVQSVVEALPAECETFLLTAPGTKSREKLLVHGVAMEAAMASGLPTLNGYSGHNPIGWELWGVHLSPLEHREFLEKIDAWRRRSGDTRILCLLELPAEPEAPIRVAMLPPAPRPSPGRPSG